MTTIMLNIGLASQSEIKIKAVTEAFSNVFPDENIIIHPFAIDSNIAEQLVTMQNGYLGAKNRLKGLKELNLELDFIVSIENYIDSSISCSNKEIWFDQGIVLIENKEQRKQMQMSLEVQFDSIYVHQSKNATPKDYQYESTGFSTTVGKLMPTINHADWHKEFSGSSRKDLLKDAIKRCLERFNEDNPFDYTKYEENILL
jgi:non-canonical (house-cleaning) NTP pyrophosphatase